MGEGRKGCLSRPLTPISPTSTRFSGDSPSRRRRRAPHRNQVNSSFFCSWPTRIPLPIAAGALVRCSACPFRSSSLRSDLLHFLLSPLSFCLRTTHYDVKPFEFLSLISISSSYSVVRSSTWMKAVHSDLRLMAYLPTWRENIRYVRTCSM